MNVRLGRDKIAAVADIAEGVVRIAILSCPKAGPCALLAYGRSTISLEERTEKQEIVAIGQLIEEAGGAALKMYASEGHLAPVTTLYAIVHAPWVRSELLSAAAHFEKETKIYDPTIGQLAQDALKTSKEVERSKIFEASVVRISLNGYPTTQPAGKSAQSVGVTSLVSDCEPAVKSAAEAALTKLFPVAAVAWRSGLRALMTLLREMPQYERCVAVDMQMTATHIASLYPDSLTQRVVPQGLRTILTRLAPGKLPEETLGNMRMLARDACSTESCEAVEKALVVAEPELARVFGEAIGQMAAERRIPNDVLLATHPDLEDWLGRFFSRIDFAQFSVTTLPLTVHTPAELDLSNFVEGDDLDPSVAIGAALVNIELRD